VALQDACNRIAQPIQHRLRAGGRPPGAVTADTAATQRLNATKPRAGARERAPQTCPLRARQNGESRGFAGHSRRRRHVRGPGRHQLSGLVAEAFQAGHEGSISFARSERSPAGQGNN
jgi:hypothetical protein